MPKGLFAGKATLDVIQFVDRSPASNQKVDAHHSLPIPGGSALNAAVTFSHLGGSAALASKVGNGAISDFIEHDLRKYNVALFDGVAGQDYALPLSTIIVNGKGERSGAVGRTPEHTEDTEVSDSLLENIIESDIVMFDTRYTRMTRDIAKAARDTGKPTVLDAGNWRPELENILPYINCAVCSDDFQPPSTTTPVEVYSFLRRRNVENIAITRGGKPTLLFDAHGKMTVVPVPSVKAIDTLGAGDIMHGAFCYYYAQEPDMRSALKQASKIASFSTRFYGTREWTQTSRADIENHFAQGQPALDFTHE